MKSIPDSGKKKTRKMNLFLQRFFSFFGTRPEFIIMRNFSVRKISIYRNSQSTAFSLEIFRLTPKRTYIPVCQKSRRKSLCQIIFQSGFFRFFSAVKFFIPKISLSPGKKSGIIFLKSRLMITRTVQLSGQRDKCTNLSAFFSHKRRNPEHLPIAFIHLR